MRAGRWPRAPAAGPLPVLPPGVSPSPVGPHPTPLFEGIAFFFSAAAEMTVWSCRGVMVLPMD